MPPMIFLIDTKHTFISSLTILYCSPLYRKKVITMLITSRSSPERMENSRKGSKIVLDMIRMNQESRFDDDSNKQLLTRRIQHRTELFNSEKHDNGLSFIINKLCCFFSKFSSAREKTMGTHFVYSTAQYEMSSEVK